MKNSLVACFVIAFSIVFLSFQEEKYPTLRIGSSIPNADLKMKDVSGQQFSLNEIKGPYGLLVIFTAQTCPFVVGSEGSEGWEKRYPLIYEYTQTAKVGMALVNSNEANRGTVDSFEEMVARAKEKNFQAKYLLDKDAQLANSFGAKTTPHVFLFDKKSKLVYKGAIDDNVKSHAEVQHHYLRNALSDLAAGKKIRVNETAPKGCGIKRK